MTETALRFEPLDHRTGDGLRLVGEIDVSNLGRLRDALASVQPEGDVHLELSELAFIDLAGTMTLLRDAGRRGPEARLVLHRPPYVLRRIMASAGVPAPAIEMVAS